MIRQKCDSWHQVLEKVYRDGETLYIKTPISAYKRDRELSDMEVIKNVRNIEISIVDIEEAVIQRVVKDKKLQVELSRLARSIKGKKELDIYTDGSLVIEALEDKETKKMGIGWVIADDSSSNCSISFSCRISDWPFSTRAELGAIWAALLVVLYRASIRIFSDSKAAIEGIQNFQGLTNIRSNFKAKNHSLINQILDCCKTKEIKLELVKVKGHSSNIWNDKADRLAKEGLISDLILEAQEVTTSKIRIFPTWKEKIIDTALRSFVNLTMTTIYESTWANLKSIKPVLNQRTMDPSSSDLNWKNTWNVLKSWQGKRCTSIKKSNALMI